MENKSNEIHAFVKSLKGYIGRLSRQQIKVLKGQAISGDLEGARKGLRKLITSQTDQILQNI